MIAPDQSAPKPSPTSGGSSGNGPPRIPRPLSEATRNMRRAALSSCYYHARANPREHRDAPRHLRPLPLEQSIAYLSEQDTQRRLQEHAIAWLLHGRKAEHLPHVERLLGKERLQLLQDSLDLEGTVAEELWQRKVMQGPEQLRKEPPVVASTVPPQPSIFGAVMNFFDTARGVRCKRSNLAVETSFDPATLVTKVTAQVDVNCDCTVSPDQQRYAVLADPQGWETRGPEYFVNSDKCDLLPLGGFVLNPVALGTEWRGRLFENVAMSWNPFFPITAQNILNCVFWKNTGPPTAIGEPRFQMNCDLSQCLSSVLGGSTLAGGLDVDTGTMTVIDLGPDAQGSRSTRIITTKEARFTEREMCGLKMGYWLNVFAPVWLGPWMGLLLFEGACAD